MSTITFEKFEIGLDRRRGRAVSDANKLWVCDNAVVTKGKVLKKKPGLEKVFTLPNNVAGEPSVGLFAAFGQLHTFSQRLLTNYTNSLFKNNIVAFPTIGGTPYVTATVDFPSSDGAGGAGDLLADISEQFHTTHAVVAGDLVTNTTTGSTGILKAPINTTLADLGFLSIQSTTPGVPDNAFFTAIGQGYTLVRPDQITNPDIIKVHQSETFEGFIYTAIEYEFGLINHHYLDSSQGDAAAGPLWLAATVYSLGEYIAPTDLNVTGLRYKATVGGTSHATTEPVWPVVVGQTVVDNGVTWTAESTYVQDINCPNHKSLVKQSSKIFSPDGDVVRFTSSGSPSPNARDWTTASDAGFINTGSESKGATEAEAVGQYQERLVVFMADGSQIWDTDPDPANIVIFKALEGIGSVWPESMVNFQGDLVFAANPGFRSIRSQSVNENLEENDIGSPIDSLVGPLAGTDVPIARYLPSNGQYWCFISDGTDTTAWVFTYSRTDKIKAWARLTYPGKNITAATVLNGLMYVRDGNDVFSIDNAGSLFTDDGTPYQMVIELPYLTFKKPGSTKYIYGFDLVLTGTPGAEVDVQFRWDPNEESFITNPITYTIPASGVLDTRVLQQIPVELTTAAIAPVFTSEDSGSMQIDLFQFHYDELGVI